MFELDITDLHFLLRPKNSSLLMIIHTAYWNTSGTGFEAGNSIYKKTNHTIIYNTVLFLVLSHLYDVYKIITDKKEV